MNTMTMIKYIFALLITALGATASAQTNSVSFGPVMDCNAMGQGSLRPRIEILGNGNPIVLWGRNSPMANYVAVGDGSAFGSAVEVSMPGIVPSVADWMGSGMAVNGNTVWVVMKATPEETRAVYVRRSDDGGMTWGDSLRVDPEDGFISRFPSIVAGNVDAPVVQYMQFDHGWMGAKQVTAKLDGPAFAAPVHVSEPFAEAEVCDCCQGQVIGEEDRVVALYRNAGSNIRVMYGAASEDGGSTFPYGAVLDNTGWVLSSCPSSGPSGYMAGDSVRYTWMSGATNGFKVYVGSAHATNLAQGPQRLVQPGLAGTISQNFPRIAGSGDTLGVVWQHSSGSQNEILFSWSTTGIGGLSEPDTVNIDLPGAQKTPDIAYANGAFHLIWSDGLSNTLRYRSATINSGVGVNELSAGDRLQVWPNPVVDVLRLSDDRWRNVEITDLQGKVVMQRAVRNGQVDLGSLAAGTYMLRPRVGSIAGPSVRFEKR